jgi:ribosomal protein S18 acetylase RimI-like enzyme
MEIRLLAYKDREGLLDLLDQSYDEVKNNSLLGESLRIKRPNRSYSRKWFADLYKNLVKRGDCIFIVAVENKNIIGFCSVIKKDIPDSEMSHIGVLGIRVAESHRGKGIGTKLIEQALKLCKGKFEIIELIVFSNNRAKRLYERLGFKTWGTAPGYIKRNNRHIDLDNMYLKL